jgi:ribonuclease P protein component
MKQFTFTKRERLSRKKEFEEVFAKGKRLSDANLILYVHPNALGYPRLGLVVSARFGNAVRRNRFKRLMREAFRLNKKNIPEGLDIVVIPGKSPELSMQKLAASMLRLLGRLA